MRGIDPLQITIDDLFYIWPDDMTEQSLIERQLKFGSGFVDGKKRILAKFAEHPSIHQFADFLKNEYGDGGRSSQKEAHWHNAKGIKMEWRSKENPIVVSLSWAQVADQISKLILRGIYDE